MVQTSPPIVGDARHALDLDPVRACWPIEARCAYDYMQSVVTRTIVNMSYEAYQGHDSSIESSDHFFRRMSRLASLMGTPVNHIAAGIDVLRDDPIAAYAVMRHLIKSLSVHQKPLPFSGGATAN